jgi:hypothetical protein
MLLTRARFIDGKNLLSHAPEQWGAREHAMLFASRREAQRAAVTIKLSGDWSVDPDFAPG